MAATLARASHPIVYLDALFISVRDGGVGTLKAVYVALGMTLDGTRDVLGLWVGDRGSEALAQRTDGPQKPRARRCLLRLLSTG